MLMGSVMVSIPVNIAGSIIGFIVVQLVEGNLAGMSGPIANIYVLVR